MATLAFLGTGLIGSGMVERQLSLGSDVVVWNRTASKTAPLAKLGARVAASPAEAVRGAERVHVALAEDRVVDDVLEQATSGLAAGQLVIDHSTTLPKTTAERASRLLGRGQRFLHAPVFMSPTACKNGAGVMLVAGPAATADAVKPALQTMTGEVWHVGERPDLAAAYKLFGNAMIFALCGGLSDVFALGKALGVDSPDVHALFSHFNVAAVLSYRGRAMAEADFSPLFELTMARKDLRLMLESAGEHTALMHVLPGLAPHFDALIARGLGDRDLGVLAVDTATKR
jgi:3-hydroxyisobutyrate dehydrogenase-like beta-hydroxyacid dehydrogenase